MIRPPYLKKGDRVGFVSPGKRLPEDMILSAKAMIESWGLRVSLARNIGSQAHNYMAGSDDERLSDLQGFLDDPAIACILCTRGGYGTTRIVDLLDFTRFLKQPKWIVGFSDITALHLALLKQGCESLHATMPVQFSQPEFRASFDLLHDALTGHPVRIVMPSSPANRQGVAHGLTLGGNLSLLIDSLATSTAPDMDGSILILEEVDEELYKIDRMLTHLGRAGKLGGLTGLVLGHFRTTRVTDPPFARSVEELIQHHVTSYSYPVAFNLPSGHGYPNDPWVHGGHAVLEVGEKAAILRYP